MKKQILKYRREIIELSTKQHSQSNHNNSKSDGRRVPRLDLSKLQRDSEEEEEEEGNSCVSIK